MWKVKVVRFFFCDVCLVWLDFLPILPTCPPSEVMIMSETWRAIGDGDGNGFLGGRIREGDSFVNDIPDNDDDDDDGQGGG
jgi:hypothetical protein